MKLTSGELRTAVVSPARFVRDRNRAIATPPAENQPRSAQREWIDAALRRYFLASRSLDILLNDYDTRTAKAKRRDTARAAIANGRNWLLCFLDWDQPEPDPWQAMRRRERRQVLGQDLSVGHDLLYSTADGPLLRELWTDDVVRRPEHAEWVALASMLHADQVFGVTIRRVEAWQLRRGKRYAWPREELLQKAPSLAMALEGIAAALADG